MDADSTPMFNSVEDECRYWKERAKLYHKEWTDVKQEFDEYVEQSRQMEAEMDATLDQKDSVIRDLRATVTSLENENGSLKLKSGSHSLEYANVEKQLENVKKERDSMKEYLRQLEQKNDDLERAHRILNESIVDFEKMLDKAYEKNALLEMEMDEKEVLQEKLQRLMDETRDLKQELNVKSRYQPNGSVNNSINSTATTASLQNGIILNNGDIMAATHDGTLTTNNTTATTNNINDYNQQNTLKRKPFPDPDTLLNGNAMTASSRTTALNIVADMLRKLNLDKALLCPQCDRFRCVCDRANFDFVRNNQEQQHKQQQHTQAEQHNDINHTTFGSCNSINTNTSTTSTNSYVTAPADDEVILRTSTNNASTVAHTPSPPLPLNKSASRSNSSLNFGTNIFKRFAERMSSGGSTIFSTTPTSAATPSKATPVQPQSNGDKAENVSRTRPSNSTASMTTNQLQQPGNVFNNSSSSGNNSSSSNSNNNRTQPQYYTPCYG